MISLFSTEPCGDLPPPPNWQITKGDGGAWRVLEEGRVIAFGPSIRHAKAFRRALLEMHEQDVHGYVAMTYAAEFMQQADALASETDSTEEDFIV